MEDERGMTPAESGPTAAELALARLREEVNHRSSQAGDQAGSAARALRQAARQLREEGNDPAARAVELAADRVERAGGWLRDSDSDGLLRDLEEFARRNALAAAAAAGLAIGYAASRMRKASSRRHGEGDSADPSRSEGDFAEPVAELPPRTGAADGEPPAGQA